jgi:hypothetical protein
MTAPPVVALSSKDVREVVGETLEFSWLFLGAAVRDNPVAGALCLGLAQVNGLAAGNSNRAIGG